jgi:hypothetical protein
MVAMSNTHRRREVPKTSPSGSSSKVITIGGDHNKSNALKAVGALIPKTSEQRFDAKRLETFSLEDFVDLLEVSHNSAPSRERSISETQALAIFDKVKNSRFDWLLGRLALISGDQISEPYRTIAILIGNFLQQAQVLIMEVIDRNWPAGLGFDVGGQIAIFDIDADGRLKRNNQLAEMNIVPALANRLIALFDGADADLFRRCAFEKCRKSFYAKRVDQLCCSRRCNNSRLQRKWYREHGKSEVYARLSRREKKR